ncbi:hypothetical protein HGRIS_005319 [Hohenbuehelia grisea]|uniref:Uncharacterized protein n=1 Tax=Hohenbuehelia grisea TaxID=104357 RepID=A0ABR3JG63_9AGAR
MVEKRQVTSALHAISRPSRLDKEQGTSPSSIARIIEPFMPISNADLRKPTVGSRLCKGWELPARRFEPSPHCHPSSSATSSRWVIASKRHESRREDRLTGSRAWNYAKLAGHAEYSSRTLEIHKLLFPSLVPSLPPHIEVLLGVSTMPGQRTELTLETAIVATNLLGTARLAQWNKEAANQLATHAEMISNDFLQGISQNPSFGDVGGLNNDIEALEKILRDILLQTQRYTSRSKKFVLRALFSRRDQEQIAHLRSRLSEFMVAFTVRVALSFLFHRRPIDQTRRTQCQWRLGPKTDA